MSGLLANKYFILFGFLFLCVFDNAHNISVEFYTCVKFLNQYRCMFGGRVLKKVCETRFYMNMTALSCLF